MSLPDDANADRAAPKALTTEGDIADIGPFAGTRAENSAEPVGTRSIGSRMLDYSAHAAMIVGLVGFAWTVSNHVVKRPTAAQIEGAATAAPAKPNDLAVLRDANQQMASDIRQLRASLDALRASVRADKTSAEVRILRAGLENVQSGLSAARAETASATAQLSGKLDKLEREPNSKLQTIADRVGRLEKGSMDLAATGSIPPAAKAVPTPTAKPVATVKVAAAEPVRKPSALDERRAAEEAAKPTVLSGYVVRDVYDGVALIEGRHGPLEVVPGVSIPGAGVVKSIDRHGNGWTVTTTKGLLAYAAPPRDYRRAGARDAYPPYRYDF